MKTNHDTAGFAGLNKQDSAFTLLELIIVIGTLGALALFLAPALAGTDDNGARMVCMHNLRQMGMASNMYCGDNRDTFAYPNWDGGNLSAPRGWLYGLSSSQGLPPGFPAGVIPNPYSSTPPYNLLSSPVNGTTAWQSGAWFQYVGNFKYYLCPVDVENKDYRLPSSAGGRVEKLSTYVMNGAVTGFPGGGTYGTPCKITDVWNPACYLLWEPDENAVAAGSPGVLEYNDGANFPSTSEGIGRLHSANGGEMMSVDGSVKFVSIQSFNAQSGSTGKSLAWWNPSSTTGH